MLVDIGPHYDAYLKGYRGFDANKAGMVDPLGRPVDLTLREPKAPSALIRLFRRVLGRNK